MIFPDAYVFDNNVDIQYLDEWVKINELGIALWEKIIEKDKQVLSDLMAIKCFPYKMVSDKKNRQTV